MALMGAAHLINATGEPQEPVPGLPAFALTLLMPEIATNHAPYLARRPAGFDRPYQHQRSEAIVAWVERDLQGTGHAVYLLRSNQVRAWAGPGPLELVAPLNASDGLYAVRGRWGIRSAPPDGHGTKGG